MSDNSKQDARQDLPLSQSSTEESSTEEAVIKLRDELESEDQADQAALENYWAGRNSAMRRSARVAA